MTRISYDDSSAEAFRAKRHLHATALTAWRKSVSGYLPARQGLRLLDLGSGTGMWGSGVHRVYDHIDVIAVEPSEQMRVRSVHQPVIGGDAEHIPLTDHSVDAAWLSTVIHHVPDLAAAAHELRRVVRPGGLVLIRSAFPGHHESITLFRYFPEAVRILDTFPTIKDVETAFNAAGFTIAALEQVPQVTAPSLREASRRFRREAHTVLQLISDDEYTTGLARLNAAAQTHTGPVIDSLDLLVLH